MAGLEVFDQKTELFKTDLPVTSDAMKSYLTVQMAQELTRAPEVTHVRDGKTIGQTGTPSKYASTTQENLINCARVVLKHINAYEPPSEGEWATLNPQKETEGGFERIEAVTDFRVARYVPNISLIVYLLIYSNVYVQCARATCA